MADDESVLGARAFDRSAPAAADAIAFTGGLGIAVGVLLVTIDVNAHGHGRWHGIALFAVLVAAGYLALGLLPRETHPAAVTLIVAGVPGAFGWWILPNADRFADIRPFLILTILAWAACWLVPRTRGRPIFVGVALILLWLWVLGEVAGTDAYSAAPVPSPPAHTMFSLSALHADVAIDDLDPSSPLYSNAQRCADGFAFACDLLYEQAPSGSDFAEFADTCGNTQAAGSGGRCVTLGSGFDSPSQLTPTPFDGGELVPGSGVVGAGAGDKSLEIGLVSLLFGVVYVAALWAFDRRRWRGLGTAMVIPGFLALFTGTEMLGNAAEHAWFGGLLTFVAGVAVALVGDLDGRRFTTWAGGVVAAFGVYTFAGDVTNFEDSFTAGDVKLVRPALITIAVGAALVALAWLIASLRSRYSGSPGSEAPAAPPGPPLLGPSTFQLPTGQPAAPPPPSAPWPPPVPPPSPPWQPPQPGGSSG